MSRIIKTKIDGVPVTLELLQVGPAESKEIKRLDKNLAKEELKAKNDAVVIPSNTQVRVVSIGDDESPATDEQKKQVEDKVNAQDAVELIGDLVESINSLPPQKDWFQSKTVWANIIVILLSIGTYFGLDIEIEPETAMTLAGLVIGGINLFLRKNTSSAIRFTK